MLEIIKLALFLAGAMATQGPKLIQLGDTTAINHGIK